MIKRRSLTREQAEHAMGEGEFGPDVASAGPNVAVLLSQDWCSQYIALNKSIDELAAGSDPAHPDVIVFELLYNRVDYFEAFMRFKETRWRNYEVPYVRYYRGGRLVGESNYVGPEGFLRFFRGAPA
jgi:hypothetical protein